MTLVITKEQLAQLTGYHRTTAEILIRRGKVQLVENNASVGSSSGESL